MKYMLSNALVAESVVRYSETACPTLHESLVEAHEHYRRVLLEAEEILLHQNIESEYIQLQTPERVREAVAWGESNIADTIKDPYRFCGTHLERMRTATAASLAEIQKAQLERMDEEARNLPLSPSRDKEGAN